MPGGAGSDWHWIWLIAAAVLAGAELLAPGIFLIFLAVAALATAVAAALGLAFPFQLALFPLFSLAAVLLGRRWYGRGGPAGDPLLNDRLSRHIGDTVTVARAIQDGQGKVRLGDTMWPCLGPDAPEGTRVRIVGSEGAMLKVEPLS